MPRFYISFRRGGLLACMLCAPPGSDLICRTRPSIWPNRLGAGGQHAVCSVSRMPELKCLGGCSDRETSELDSKICWFSTDLRKYDTAPLEPWRRSATILSRVGRSPPEVLEAIGRQFGISNSPIGPLRR